MRQPRRRQAASERLHQAQLAAIDGRHEEALREYEWFHRNALKHEPSLYGVRLSFALWYWTELGKVYPKARRSLERIRREKMATLRSGRGSRDLFHDVAAINRALSKHVDTYRVFRWLDARRPRMAARCARVALPALVEARAFKLARRHVPDPESRLAEYAMFLNTRLAEIPGRITRSKTQAPAKRAYLQNYCNDAGLLIGILRGTGERNRARLLRRSALALIDPPSARRFVAERLRDDSR